VWTLCLVQGQSSSDRSIRKHQTNHWFDTLDRVGGGQVLAFEDAIPLSSRFAIMKVQMEGSAPGSSGPLDHIADSVRCEPRRALAMGTHVG
jgi:hypothetical protein